MTGTKTKSNIKLIYQTPNLVIDKKNEKKIIENSCTSKISHKELPELKNRYQKTTAKKPRKYGTRISPQIPKSA